MPLFVCHVGWMRDYEGRKGVPDTIVGGGAWVMKHGRGGEVCNFLRCSNGNVYGHFETIKKKRDRPVSIELLGVDRDAEYIDGVDVLWTATHPMEGQRRVVGWYRNARIYRERQYFSKYPTEQHKRDQIESYRVRARARDATVLPLKDRTLKLGRGKGWIGQANWWFLEVFQQAAVKRFARTARRLMEASSRPRSSLKETRRRGKWGGATSPERKAEVEHAAIAAVEAYYAGCRIKNVEKENLGWDLEVLRRGRKPLRLEVKGLFASDLQIGLTPREYRALVRHKSGEMDNYRLCVVTGALKKTPRLVIFHYSGSARGWINDNSGRAVSPTIKTLEAAIVSLSS
jgi:hypothetical protein